MSHAIVQTLSRNEETALVDAIAWMRTCRYGTPEAWSAYSKLMLTTLESLPKLSHFVPTHDIAHAIVRYCAASRENLLHAPWNTPAFLAFYSTFEHWLNVPVSVWMELSKVPLNTTALYQWSLDNQRMQEQLLQNKYPGGLSCEPLHTHLARTHLEHALAGRPMLLGASVHWNVWTVFHEESLALDPTSFSRRVQALTRATPISFEHAITECYQHAPQRFNQKSCIALLEMDLTQGHALTACCGVLLLYHRFRNKGSRVLCGVKRRHPGLLEGFEIHLGIYSDIDNAMVHADAIMDHWRRIVHHNDVLGSIDLPENVLD